MVLNQKLKTNQTIYINQKLHFHKPNEETCATVGFISFGILEEEKETSYSEDVLQLITGGE